MTVSPRTEARELLQPFATNLTRVQETVTQKDAKMTGLINGLARTVELRNATIAGLSQRNTSLDLQVQNLTHELGTEKDTTTELRDRVAELELNVGTESQAKEKALAQVEELTRTVATVSGVKDQALEEVAQLTNQNGTLSGRVGALTTEVTDERRQKEVALKKNEELNKQLGIQTRTNGSLTDEVERLKELFAATKAQLEALTERHAQVMSQTSQDLLAAATKAAKLLDDTLHT